MPRFTFVTRDGDGTTPADRMFEFPDMESAVVEAKKTLAEMALDGIPSSHDQPIWVEIFDEHLNRVAKIALELSIEFGPRNNGNNQECCHFAGRR